jgi:(5-formylfuran-3-yl)methyl phosphate synthase
MDCQMTQLLVSVRNAVEAIIAIGGGADIIDVKEPFHGSLGCAAPKTIREISLALKSLNGPLAPLSLALGELTEWHCSPTCPQVGIQTHQKQLSDLRATIESSSPQFLKLGLAGTFPSRIAWRTEWQRVQASIQGDHSWVAVAYADHSAAAAPPVADVLHAAIETSAAVLLIDTYTKDGTSLCDHLTFSELTNLRHETSQHGIQLALAGRISVSDLPQLISVQPDIIAVRSAVCEHSNRTASISEKRIHEFRNALRIAES